ncbi:MAG: 50S ribosomal protein L3 N(5)-glutamine methyltransferase [Pseudohongiellaceae bacterium]
MLFNTNQILKQIISLTSKELEQADLFFGHGTDNPWDEACWLVETLVKRSGIDQINAEMKLDIVVLNQLQELLIKRTKEKIPLAYLLNEAWFSGLPFYVDTSAVIPRSPIAELITHRFNPLINNEPERILDLCCGNGCIGVASALKFPDAKVVFADLSTKALKVASINIEKHGLNNRSFIEHSNLFEGLEGRFDLIVSNPPYVGEEEYATLPLEYKHEPIMGLVSKQNGLNTSIEILRQAPNFLTDKGVLILEVGNSWLTLADLYPEIPFLWLEFEKGGEGVLSLSYQKLLNYNF